MQFEIKSGITAKVLLTAKLSAEYESASDGVKLGAAVKLAVKARADLTGADLTGAYLSRADLTGANLAGAYLARANLAGAVTIDPKEVPVVPNIDAAILAAIEGGGVLDMGSWHGPKDEWCGTTHCRAGWAVHLAGEAGKALEDKFGAQRAGALIYRASRPGVPAPWFFAPTDVALADIRECARASS